MTSPIDQGEALAALTASADVKRVADKLSKQFGPGFSNGVVGILLHESLPVVFSKRHWKDWFFKPAPKAFTWARDEDLIVQRGRGKWSFTPLGLALREHIHTNMEGERP